jgi:hypothetical protein
VNLRRVKMKQLKEELSQIGASVSAPDVDAGQLTGMRRLRLLHSRVKKSLETEKPAKDAKSESVTQENIKAVKIEETVSTDGSVKKEIKAVTIKRVLAEGEEGLLGMSRTTTILVFLGGALFIIFMSYLTYKYIKWKPKMVAKKGYKAVAKSKGIDVNDSDAVGGESSGSAPTTGRSGAPALIVASKA